MTLSNLTERQRMFAVMVRCGYTNKEIAALTGLTPCGVRNNLAVIYRSLGIDGMHYKRVMLAVMIAEERNDIRSRG